MRRFALGVVGLLSALVLATCAAPGGGPAVPVGVVGQAICAAEGWRAINPAPTLDDSVGFSLATVGGRIITGAPTEDTTALNAGTVYVFGSSGALVATVANPEPDTVELFGNAVAAYDAERFLVGAPRNNAGATGNAGSVYLMDTSGTVVLEYLNPTPANGDRFGHAVAAAFGGEVLVGAPLDNDDGLDAGIAFVFEADGTLRLTLQSPTPAANDELGTAVAAVGTSFVVSAPKDEVGAINEHGTVYVFSSSGALTATLANPTPQANDRFGAVLAPVGTDKVLVGAPNTSNGVGEVYLFSLDGSLLMTLQNPTPALNEEFGSALATAGNDLVVGSRRDQEGGLSTGAVYLFDAATGAQLLRIPDPNPASLDAFGSAVAVLGFDFVVGDPQDDEGASNSGAVHLVSGNTPPDADSQSLTVPEDGSIGITLTGTDRQGNPLTFSIVDGPSNGSVTGVPPDVTYLPDTNLDTTDSFQFVANDGCTDSVPVTVNITVTPENDPPLLANPGDQAVDEASTLAFALFATDPDTVETLTFSQSNAPAGATLDPVTGAFSWTPDSDDSLGSPYSITFTVTDALGEFDAKTIAVTVTNPAPALADPGDRTADEGSLLSFTLSAIDPDGDLLTYAGSGLPAGATLDTASGLFAWTPGATDAGTYAIGFTATDAQGASDAESIQVTVQNPAPVLGAIGDRAVAETSTLAFTLTATDDDAVAYSATGLPAGATLDPVTGAFSWTPDADDANGSSYSITFTATDDDSATDVETIDVTVSNPAPVVANPGNQTVNEESLLAFNVTAADPDGDAFVLSVMDLPGGATFTSAGAFSWTPDDADLAGSPYAVTFLATDVQNAIGSITIDITVMAVNDAPVAVADAYSTDEDTALTVLAVDGLLSNDTDVDSMILTAAVVDMPANGTLALAMDGSFTYSPDQDYFGPDAFTYLANDGAADSAVTTVSLTVVAVNDAPVGAADAFSTPEDVPLVVTVTTAGVLANDGDVDSVDLVAMLVTQPLHGTLQLQTNGTFQYAPAADYSGVDSFEYRAEDGLADSGSVLVSLTITGVNDLPAAPALAMPAAGVELDSGEVAFSWTAATDADGDTLTYTIEVLDEDGLVAHTGSTSALALTLEGGEALDDGAYTWHVTAADGTGSGPQSASLAFVVDSPSGGGAGCGCTTVPTRTTSGAGAPFVLAAMAAGWLWRRRRQSGH